EAGSEATAQERARGVRRERARARRSPGYRRARGHVGVVLTEPRPHRRLGAQDAARSRPAGRLGSADRRRARDPSRVSSDSGARLGRRGPRLATACGARYFFAASEAWKPTLLCVPSHNGLLLDAPHRQSAILAWPAV